MTLPPGWARATLHDVAQFERGIAFPSSDKKLECSAGLIACLRTANVQAEVDWDDLWFIPRTHVRDETKLLRVDDILISTANSQHLVGKVARVRAVPTEATLGAFIGLLRARPSVCSGYLHHKLASAPFQEALRGTASQTTNIANISTGAMNALGLELPPAAEQVRIAARLDAIFEQTRAAKARLERLPALLEKLKRAILAAAFRGDLTAGLRGLPEPSTAQLLASLEQRSGDSTPSRLLFAARQAAAVGSILAQSDSPWPMLPISHLVNRLTNGFVGPTRGIYVDAGSGVPYLLSKHVKDGRLTFDNGTYISPEFNAKSEKSILRAGDVLLVQTGHVGASAVVPPEHAGHNCHAMIVITPRDHLLSGEFLSLYFQSAAVQRELGGIEKGMTLRHLNCHDVVKLLIPLPSLDEQRAIVRRVNELLAIVRELCERAEACEMELDHVEQAALAKAFRGELVPQDPDDEPAEKLLERIRAARAAEPEKGGRGRAKVKPRAEAPTATASSRAPSEPDAAELVIAAFQNGEPRLKASDIADATGLPRDVVKDALTTLVEAGQVRALGKGRGTTYVWSA